MFDVGTRIALTAIFVSLIVGGFQVTASLVVSVLLLMAGFGGLWWQWFPEIYAYLHVPWDANLSFYGGWGMIVVGCLLYARFLRTGHSLPSSTPPQLNPSLQSSSTSQGGSVINNITDIPKNRVPSPRVREAIRSDLKPFFTRGYELLHFYESSKYRDEEPWQEWVQDVTIFLRNSLDESYVDRWNSHEGLPVSSALTPFSPLPAEVPGRNRKLYVDIFFRLQRLEEFNNELKG